VTAPTALLRRIAGAVWRRRVVAVPLGLAAAVTASATGISVIRIQPGDTLTALAARYHTTVGRLVALNHLPGNGDLIIAGQTLKVPGSASGGGGSGAGLSVTHYTVRRGDTLSGIAARFHASQGRIARRNHLPSSLIVVIGQTLSIPVRHASSGASAPSQGGPGNAAALHDRDVLAHRFEPDSDQVASMIRTESSRFGLDPRLALAISWQESGWNMREVSGVDAIGAMQVMPSTAEWVADNILHRSLDLYNAQDNVAAGVALLSVLVHEAGKESVAAAGYYQGLASVHDHGMFADTKQYVADVMALRSRF
jgi:LysM repeat protein